MKEESLIDEMRAALGSDQARAEARRRTARLERVVGSEPVVPTQGPTPARTLRSRLGRLLGRSKLGI
jgi:hypothetical protein